MKKILIFALTLALCGQGIAQSARDQRRQERQARKETKSKTTQVAETDPKAKVFMDKFAKVLDSKKTIQLNFTYYIENKKENKNESKKGVILYLDGKYNIDFLGRKIISDGKTVWSHSAELNEVQISKADATNSVNPLDMINSYKDHFRTKLIREDVMEGVAVAVIDLTPIDAQNFFKVRLVINKVQNMLKLMEIYSTDGSVFAYKIDKYIANVKSSKTTFSFDVKDHKGIEVVDLR